MDSDKNIAHFPVQYGQHQQHPGAMVPYDPYANQYVPEDEIDLRELWQIVRKHRNTILAFLGIIFFTTLLATLLMRPVYRATATVEAKPDSGSVVKFQNIEAESLQTNEFLETQTNIIESRTVANAVIKKLNLQDNPEINGELSQRGFVSGIKQILAVFRGKDSDEVSAEDKQVSLADNFSEHLTVSPVKRSYLFNVSFDSFDPELSRNIANAVVTEYINLNEQRRFNSSAGAKAFLQKEIEKIKAKLESSEKDLTEFARKNQVVDVEEKSNIMTERLGELSTQLSQVTGERIAAEALYKQAQDPQGVESIGAVLSNELIQKYKSEYSTLQGEYFKLSRIYKPAYPKLQQLQSQLSEIKGQMDAEIGRLTDGFKVNYEQLQKKETLLTAQIEKLKQDMLDVKDRAIQYNILKREWESNKQLYAGLLDRMKEVGVAAGLELNNITLVDKAIKPQHQYKPNLKLNLALATVLGLFGGIGLAFLIEFLNNTVRTPEELEKVSGMSNLGLVPVFKDMSKGRKGKKSTAPVLPDGLVLELISHTHRESNVSESFRSLRTSLMFSTPEGLPKIIQVTSTGPEEGKTTIAINLAAVLADNGANVLFIDGDLRKPRAHKVFGVPSAPGLTEALVGGVSRLRIRETGIDNLSFLPVGTIPPNPAELLGSKEFDDLLETVIGRYDHVIIDSAPLMGLADAVILSSKCRGVIYSVLAGEVNRDALKEGVKRLRMVRAPLLGAVLNKVDLESGDYGYYAYQYYNYEYGHKYDQPKATPPTIKNRA